MDIKKKKGGGNKMPRRTTDVGRHRSVVTLRASEIWECIDRKRGTGRYVKPI